MAEHPGDCPVTLSYGHEPGVPGCVAKREPDLVLRHEDQGPWLALSSPGRLSVHVTMAHLRERLLEMGHRVAPVGDAEALDVERLRRAIRAWIETDYRPRLKYPAGSGYRKSYIVPSLREDMAEELAELYDRDDYGRLSPTSVGGSDD